MNPAEPAAPAPVLADGRSMMPRMVMRLEDRIVLDAVADAGADSRSSAEGQTAAHPGQDHPPAPDAPAAPTPNSATDGEPADSADGAGDAVSSVVENAVAAILDADAHDQAAPRVLAISSRVDENGSLTAAVSSDVVATVFDGDHVTLDALLRQIRDALGGRSAQGIGLATHGLGDGRFELATGCPVSLETLHHPEMQAFWKGLAEFVGPDGRIDLLACDAAAGTQGRALLAALEDLTGVNFAASADTTGNIEHGGDWELESDRVEAGALYFDPTRLAGFDQVLANPPTLTDSDPGSTAQGGGGAIVVDSGLTITAGDTGDLQGAAVRIKSGFAAGEDRLSFDTTLATSLGISGSYDAATGQLLLAGNASAADYQQVLRSVTYRNLSATPDTTPREIFFVLGDDFDNYRFSDTTGHYYELVDNQLRWAQADAAADGSALHGLRGYLATVTSAAENALVTGLIAVGQQPWLGASDTESLGAIEGEWYWVTGPEAGTQFWTGGLGGSAVGGLYSNWGAGEPDDEGNSDYVAILSSGIWGDAKGNVNLRYLVEYGGLGTDAEGQLTASVVVNVTDTNDAPVLDRSGVMSLTAINEDHVTGGGDTVGAIIASAGGDRITDADPGALEGIALLGIDSSHGTWQFSTDGGASWRDIGAVSSDHALLLRDSDLLRFEPDADWNGTVANGITFRAWDQTSGTAGDYADASAGGGTTAFSSATETASIDVHAVNDAPTLDASGDMSLTSINEDVISPAGDTIASILASAGGDRLTDVDDGALEGIALIGIDDAHGKWQYSTDGGASWLDVGAVAEHDALLLRANDLLRFRPDADFHGTIPDGITFRAWDQTAGAAGGHADTTSAGGVTPFSAAFETADLLVHAVNDAPAVALPLADQSATEDVVFTFQFASGTFTDADLGDTLTYSATLADGGALPDWLVFDPVARRFTGTPANGDVGTLAVKVTASDGHGGVASDVFNLTVANVNDAPTVANPLVDQSATAGSRFTYQFTPNTFRDVDAGDSLTYTATLADGSPLPGWLAFDAATRTFSGDPPATGLGGMTVKVTASDGHGGIATDTFAITVSAGEEPPPDPVTPPRADGGTSGTSSGGSSGSSGSSDTSGGSADSPGFAQDDGGDAGGSDAAASADAGDAADTADSPSAETAVDADDGGTGGDAADVGGETSATGADADGGSPAIDAIANSSSTGGADERSDVAYREREEEGDWTASELSLQFNEAMLSSDLISDESQPVEFREAWGTILAAYADSGAEVSVYLQSAFRAVTESALVYQAADQSIDAMNQELASAAEAGVTVEAEGLLADLERARAEVKAASARLEAAIQTAAQAGRDGKFDRALEDVISTALRRLMQANEQLFAESQALAAAAAALRDARGAGATELDQARLEGAAAQAKLDGHAEIAVMRKSWDRAAQDVFSAFVARLVTAQDAEAETLPLEQPGLFPPGNTLK